MAKFRKKPVVIEAWPTRELIRASKTQWASLPICVVEAYEQGGWVFYSDHISIPTLEGTHRAEIDDMIIRGVAGEFYPCKSSIFKETYDAVE
jgi:hypothetical protein